MSIYQIKDPACSLWRVIWDQYTNTLTLNFKPGAHMTNQRFQTMIKNGYELTKVARNGAEFPKVKVVFTSDKTIKNTKKETIIKSDESLMLENRIEDLPPLKTEPHVEFPKRELPDEIMTKDGNNITFEGSIEDLPPPDYVFETGKRSNFTEYGLALNEQKNLRNSIIVHFNVQQYWRMRDGAFTPDIKPCLEDLFYTIHMHDKTLLTQTGFIELFDHFVIDPTSPPNNLKSPLAKGAATRDRGTENGENSVVNAVSKIAKRSMVKPKMDKKIPSMLDDTPPPKPRYR